MMNKRALRKFVGSDRKLNLHSGVFHAEQVLYVVCTAVHNIGGRRTLVLYVYPKEDTTAGDVSPRWILFQTMDEYLTLCCDEKGKRWQTAMFCNLGKECDFTRKCAFYSLADQDRVTRFCKAQGKKGFDSLFVLQWTQLLKRREENQRKKERKILKRMKSVGLLPRDIKGFMHRETLPQYVFYDYQRGKPPANGYCTACRHEVEIPRAKHNEKGVCPRCRKPVTFKSRGKRGYILDRSTAQVIQRTGENELVIRFVKSYCRYDKRDTPELYVYENARLFLKWDGGKLTAIEPYYYSYNTGSLTPWHKGERPVFSRWRYNFEADGCGYLYHRKLNTELEGTPWRYSALKEYYSADPTPLYVASYLTEYLRYPMLEYLVKLRLYRLATYVVYGDGNGNRYYGNRVLDSSGKTITEVLGVEKKYLPLLQEVNPGGDQLLLIRGMLREHERLDVELLKWCSEYAVKDEENIRIPLRFMTPYKLMKYATEQFETHKKVSYLDNGYYSMSYLLTDYKDYLCMSEALDFDMKNSFVLFPKDLKAAHDRVNDLSEEECREAYNQKIARDFTRFQSRYQFQGAGLMITPPHSAEEIVNEGQKLHHCVGQYVKKVVQGNCVILFIRKTEEPDKPYCTVELKNGEVTQARINNNGNPPPQVAAFIEQWKQQVLYAPAAAA